MLFRALIVSFNGLPVKTTAPQNVTDNTKEYRSVTAQ